MRKSRKTKGGMNFFRSLFNTDPSVAIKKVEKSITEKKKELKELEDKLDKLIATGVLRSLFLFFFSPVKLGSPLT